MQKQALVTGAAGQSGSYLCDLLLGKGYEVHALIRRSSVEKLDNIKQCLDNPNFHLHFGDFTDGFLVAGLVKIGFDEIYHAGAASHVGYSFIHPCMNIEVNTIPVISFLENIKNFTPYTRFLVFGSSEQWGNNYREEDGRKIQDLDVPFDGRSPYSISKISSYHFVKLYREAYGLYCIMPLAHNHESPRRSNDFLTQKCIKYIGRLYRGELREGEKLQLGNLSPVRTWGYAPEICEGMWMALQQDNPEDYVFCAEEGHSVKEFVEYAFKLIGENWKDHVVISEHLYRPCEVQYLQGSYKKAKEKLGWEPKTDFYKLIKIMLEAEIGNYNMENVLHSIRSFDGVGV